MLQQLVNGRFSSVYAQLALGYTHGLRNYQAHQPAHGDIYMMGALSVIS